MYLSPEQMKAIRISKLIGIEIQSRFPEVADDYRDIITLEKIVDLHQIHRTFRIKKRMAVKSLDCAIVGHSGGFGVLAYDGLITDAYELEALRFEHRRNFGLYTQKAGIGIYARTHKQMQLDGSKGGTISGNNHKKNKTGVCGMTRDKLQEAGIKSAKSQGFVPWVPRTKAGRVYIPSEIEYAYQQSEDPEYWVGSKISHIKIANELNENYHSGNPIRTGATVKAALQRYYK